MYVAFKITQKFCQTSTRKTTQDPPEHAPCATPWAWRPSPRRLCCCSRRGRCRSPTTNPPWPLPRPRTTSRRTPSDGLWCQRAAGLQGAGVAHSPVAVGTLYFACNFANFSPLHSALGSPPDLGVSMRKPRIRPLRPRLRQTREFHRNN